MAFHTSDLSDALEDRVHILVPMLHDFGGVSRFNGPISTVKCFEDNSLVGAALEEPGQGRVLVIDGGGSLRCALLGDRLAALGARNGWSGILVYGCIRDSEAIARTSIGVKAMATHPRKSVKRGVGERDLPVHFGGLTFTPGHFVYADPDGVLVSEMAVSLD